MLNAGNIPILIGMKRIQPQPTSNAEWHRLVEEALFQSGYRFDASLSHYLVITLDSYSTDNSLARSVIAVDYLTSIQISGLRGQQQLRQVGDHCLILSGLFPECALKKHVSLDYFIQLGKVAYQQLADLEHKLSLDPALFNKLSTNFVGLMDVLHLMRHDKASI